MAQILSGGGYSGNGGGNDRRSIRSSKLIGSRESLEYETGTNDEVFMTITN